MAGDRSAAVGCPRINGPGLTKRQTLRDRDHDYDDRLKRLKQARDEPDEGARPAARASSARNQYARRDRAAACPAIAEALAAIPGMRTLPGGGTSAMRCSSAL